MWRKGWNKNLLVIGIMAAGVLTGYFFGRKKWNKVNFWIQFFCVVLLIFSMGVKLGSRENFITEIVSLGTTSLLFALLPILFSIVLVYLLTTRFLKQAKKDNEEEED